MSFKHYTEKLRRKKLIFFPDLDHHPGSGSVDPDPHQNDTDPKRWLRALEKSLISTCSTRTSHTT